MKRFPLRTLLLMIVAVIAFVRFWWATHPRPAPKPAGLLQVQPLPSLPRPDGG